MNTYVPLLLRNMTHPRAILKRRGSKQENKQESRGG